MKEAQHERPPSSCVLDRRVPGPGKSLKFRGVPRPEPSIRESIPQGYRGGKLQKKKKKARIEVAAVLVFAAICADLLVKDKRG
jgi:hypothetical protein